MSVSVCICVPVCVCLSVCVCVLACVRQSLRELSDNTASATYEKVQFHCYGDGCVGGLAPCWEVLVNADGRVSARGITTGTAPIQRRARHTCARTHIHTHTHTLYTLIYLHSGHSRRGTRGRENTHRLYSQMYQMKIMYACS